ncbi:MAG: ATP-binding protein [Lachnospiraceae bacterium]|nr:ATP-binding protein [Lachnospiraceae bacterium]
MIKKFSCSNFKNVSVQNLEFSRINVLIGPNNSGKTNFIRALSFCADMVNRSEQLIGNSAFQALVSDYGVGDVYNKFAEGLSREIALQWEIELESGKSVEYDLNFHTGNQMHDFFITHESLDNRYRSMNRENEFNYFTCHEKAGEGYISKVSDEGEENCRIKFEIPMNDTVLRQFDQIRLTNRNIYENADKQVDMIHALQKYFGNYYSYSSAQFDLGKIREPQNIQANGVTLEKTGENFANVFNFYKSKDIYMVRTFLGKIRELMPTIDSADTVTEFNKLAFKIGYEGKQFSLNDLSDGTIKALLLTMLIFVPINEGFSMLAIDEPEMNIHPAWQQIIGRWLQYSDNFEQCFISTHSPDFLDTFTEGFKRGEVSVIVFDPREKKQIKKLQYSDMAQDLEDWELGDLYRVNDPSIGGWPW